MNFNILMVEGYVMYGVFADLPVVTVTAHDADDSTEGSNARLLYAIEKNVLDENTGAPMFQVSHYSLYGLLTFNNFSYFLKLFLSSIVNFFKLNGNKICILL